MIKLSYSLIVALIANDDPAADRLIFRLSEDYSAIIPPYGARYQGGR